MALSHHSTAHSNQRSGRKAPFLSAHHASNGNVATSPDLTVGLHGHATTQVVEHKRLIGLGETKLSRQTRVLDAPPCDWHAEAFLAHFNLAQLFFDGGSFGGAYAHLELAKLYAVRGTFRFSLTMES